MKIILKIFIGLIGLALGAFTVTQVIYWLNLDNKFFFFIVDPILYKHYDKVKRDRKF